MQIIDIEKWKRKEHFNFFHRMDYPQYNICFDLNITNFLKFVKNNNLSFYYSMIYYVTITANKIEELKYRIRDDKIILHDTIHPSFTDLGKDDDLFKLLTINVEGDLLDFIKISKSRSLEQKEYFPIKELTGRDDLIYITCLPWISFTHISHTISLNKNDAVPRISWGKYYNDNNGCFLPFSVQVNHAFVDGIHVGKYKDELEKEINSCYL